MSYNFDPHNQCCLLKDKNVYIILLFDCKDLLIFSMGYQIDMDKYVCQLIIC